jgi:hypothetical protein
MPPRSVTLGYKPPINGLSRFRRLIDQAVNHARDEPGVVDYEWMMVVDGSRAILRMTLREDVDLIEHMKGDAGRVEFVLMREAAEMVRFEIFGSLGKEAREALAPMKPVILCGVVGHTRLVKGPILPIVC